MKDKTKVKLSIFAIQLALAMLGVYLISDVKVLIGVVCIMFSNNFNFKTKDCVSDPK